MNLIRLIISLSLTLTFMASASESNKAGLYTADNTEHSLHVVSSQLPGILCSHSSLSDLSSFFNGDADPDAILAAAFDGSAVLRSNGSKLRYSQFMQSVATRWLLIHGPPLA